MNMKFDRLNRSELIEATAQETDLSVSKVKEVVDTFLRSIEIGLKNDKIITISGFGTFKVDMHKGHPIQFKGGQKEYIEDYLVLKFNVSKVFKDGLRSEYKCSKK